MKLFQQNSATGGIAQGTKDGYEGSFQDGQSIDYRSDPDKIQVGYALVKESGVVVTDLIKWMLEHEGEIYFYGDTGKIYKRDSAGAYTNIKTVSSSTGQGFAIFNDELWYANDDGIGKATDLDTTPVYYDDYFITPTQEGPDYSASTAANSYTLTTGVNEGATHKLTFTASVDSFYGVSLNVTAKGTGDWTIVLHDSSDTVVATLTIATADMPSSGLTRFRFDTIYDLTVDDTYHIHVYSTVADGTLKVDTSSDISTAEGAVLQYIGSLDTDQTSLPAGSVFTAPGYYTVSGSISEDATDLFSFTPAAANLNGISLLFLDKGSQTITLTLHDSLNRTVSTATVTTANMQEGGAWQRFDFTTPLSLTVGATYHVHITTSSGSPTTISATGSDLSDTYYKTHFAILESDSNYHPMKVFLNKLVVGHGNYLLTIDDSEVLTREAIVFPFGEKVRAIEAIGDLLIVSTWRGDDLGAYGDSRLYIWDGTAEGFNRFIDIAGQTNAMQAFFNALYYFHGTRGNLSIYTGGLTELREMKYSNVGTSIEIMPGAIDSWEKLLLFGLSNITGDAIENAVYSYGRTDKDYPRSLNKEYVISTGHTDSDVEIGAIKGVSSSKLFVGWKDTLGAYLFDGVDDVIEAANSAAITSLMASGGSVSFWLNPSSDGEGNDGYILNKEGDWRIVTTGESGGNIALRFIQRFSSTNGIWDTDVNIPIGSWTHFAIVYDNGATTNDPVFYVNGVSVTVNETDTPVGTAETSNSNDLNIGNWGGLTKAYDGYVSDIKLFSTGLSAAEADSVYKDEVITYNPVRWYKCDEGSGTTATDEMGDASGTISASNESTFHAERTVYGVDNIDTTNKVRYAKIDFLRETGGGDLEHYQKDLTGVSLRFDALSYAGTEGEKLELFYRMEGSAWTSLGTVDPITDTNDQGIIYKSFAAPTDAATGVSKFTRFFEIEFRVVFTTTTINPVTMPTLLGIRANVELIKEEQIGRV